MTYVDVSITTDSKDAVLFTLAIFVSVYFMRMRKRRTEYVTKVTEPPLCALCVSCILSNAKAYLVTLYLHKTFALIEYIYIKRYH